MDCYCTAPFPNLQASASRLRYAQLTGVKPLPVQRAPSKSNSAVTSLQYQSPPAFYYETPLFLEGIPDCTTPHFTPSTSPSYQPLYPIQLEQRLKNSHQPPSSTSMQPVFANPVGKSSPLSSEPVAIYQSYHGTQDQYCGGPTGSPLGVHPSPRSSPRRLEHLQIPSQSPLVYDSRYFSPSHLAPIEPRTYSKNLDRSFVLDAVQYACGYPIPPQQQLVQSRGQLSTPSSKTWPALHDELVFKDQSLPGPSENLNLPAQSPNNSLVQHVPTSHQKETVNNVQQLWLDTTSSKSTALHAPILSVSSIAHHRRFLVTQKVSSRPPPSKD